MPQYVVRRNKKDDQIVFGGAARALKMQPVGSVSAQMSSSGNANNLDLIQTDRGEDIGTEYKLLFDIPFNEFRTRQYNSDRTSLEGKVSYGTTTTAIAGINAVTEFQSADLNEGNGGVGIGTTRADDEKLNWGNDNDLQIWHDGTDSNIADVGTGNLHIASQDFTVMYDPNKNFKRAVFGDYNVSFFYGNVEKFKTKSYGVNITGICSATQFQGDGSLLTGITAGIGTTGSINTSGVITATSFSGDGSALTGIAYTTLSGIPSVPLTVNEFGYYQQYASPVGNGDATTGPRIYDPEPAYSNNPFYYGVTLKPGSEMRWTHHGDSSTEKYAVGIWGGALSFTPTNAFNTVYWSRVARFDHNIVDFGTTNFDSKGFTPSAGANVHYSISTSTSLSLAYNKYTNKLEVHDITGGSREIIATADTAEDGNPVTISFAISADGALPGITTVTEYEYPSNWYVGYGATSNQVLATPFLTSNNREHHPVYWPQRLEPGYEYRFTSLNGSVADHFYVLGIWGGNTDEAYGFRSYFHLNWDTCFSLGTNAVTNFLAPSGADNYFSSGDDNASVNTTVASATSTSFPKGEILTLNYSPTDGKLRLINESQGYVAFGTSNNAFTGPQKIHMGGKNALVAAPTLVKRDQSWEMIAYRYDSGANPGKGWNWRDGGSRPFVNMSSTRDLLPGQRVEFKIPFSGSNHYYWIAAGGWKGPTGKTNDLSATSHVDTGSDLYWRWDTGEDTSLDDGWTYNTSNSKYDSSNGDWNGGNDYEHHLQYRYRTSDNKVEWWDVTPDNASAPERIATSTGNLGGGAIRMGIVSIQNDIRASGTHIDLKELTYSLS